MVGYLGCEMLGYAEWSRLLWIHHDSRTSAGVSLNAWHWLHYMVSVSVDSPFNGRVTKWMDSLNGLKIGYDDMEPPKWLGCLFGFPFKSQQRVHIFTTPPMRA